ncbi:MAG: DUF4124 domain-containing protein [Nitrospira sp. CR1.2]|nr:DUF4124 domain-containing protein [Nitrospira sp. CR1.2]
MFHSRTSLTSAALLALWYSISLFSVAPILAATTIYSYTNDEGVQTFTNELDAVPDQYRPQLRLQRFDTEPDPAAPPPAAAADARIRSTDTRTLAAGGEYRMGDLDNRADAIRLATESAKRDALEQVATYIERITEVRDLNVTRDDIRSFTAGIVKVLDQTVTTRLEQDHVVIRVDLTAEVDPHDVTQAIAALRENEQARHELLALRAETDRLQAELDETNRTLASAATPSDVQHYTDQRQDMLNQLEANALLSQAWTSWTYPTVSFYSVPWFGAPGINGLLIQAQRLYPGHHHLPLAQRTIAANGNNAPSAQTALPASPRHSLLVPPLPRLSQHHTPPLLNSQGQPAKVGDVVVLPTPRSVPATPQYTPQAPPYQLHPNHFWRPSPPNIHSMPSASHQNQPAGMAPRSSVGPMGGSGRGYGGGGHRGR